MKLTREAVKRGVHPVSKEAMDWAASCMPEIERYKAMEAEYGPTRDKSLDRAARPRGRSAGKGHGFGFSRLMISWNDSPGLTRIASTISASDSSGASAPISKWQPG